MIYTIKAHPTRYGGVEFRSRLEARWAAYFDLIGWRWEYEPFDLHGWVPDFRLSLPSVPNREGEYWGVKYIRSPRILAEIKPVEADPADEMVVPAAFDAERIERAVAGQETLLFGLTPAHVWRVPDASFTQGFYLNLGDAECWREAGNRVQWRPR